MKFERRLAAILCWLSLLAFIAPAALAQQPTSPQDTTTPAAPPETQAKPADSKPAEAVATKPVDTSAPATEKPKGFVASFVESDRKWQLGFRHEPYNKLSAHMVEQLVKELAAKGISKVDTTGGSCCSVKIELLQVSTRQAIIKKPGIDVAVNVIVTDARNKVVYSKGYSGKSGTAFINTWGHLIDDACEDASKNMAADENLLSVLRTGKLPD